MNSISFNENYFDKLDSIEKFYWLGFFAGRVNFPRGPRRRNTVSIFVSRPRAIKLARAIEHKSVRNSSHQNACGIPTATIHFTSSYFKNRLKQLGISENGTTLPAIKSHEFLPFYLRGYYEGRVNVGINRVLSLRLYGQPAFLKDLRSLLEKKVKINIRNDIFKIKKANCHYLPITRMNSVKKIIEFIYQPPPFTYNGNLFSRSKQIVKEINERLGI